MRSLSAPRRGEVHTQRFPAPPAPGFPHPKLWPRKVTHGSSPGTPRRRGFPQPCFFIFYDFFQFAPQAPSCTQRDAPGSTRAAPRHHSSTIPKTTPLQSSCHHIPLRFTLKHHLYTHFYPYRNQQEALEAPGRRRAALRSSRADTVGLKKERGAFIYLFSFSFLFFFLFLKADCLSRCLYL